MMRKSFYSLADFLLRIISANGARSYSLAGIRFLTAADIKQAFPECIINEGPSETYSIPAIEKGKTAFLLEGAEVDPAGLFSSYDLRLEAPFSARFQADARRKLFAASGSLLVRDEELGAFLLSPELKSSRRLGSVFRSVSSESVDSFTAISSIKSCTFGDFGLAMLPKLARIAGSSQNGRLMLPAYSYVTQYLKLFQLELFSPEINTKQLVPIRDFAEVVVGPGSDEGFVCHSSDIGKLQERVVPLLPETPYKKVYFRRGARRKILNEEECLPLLKRLGFEIIEDDHVDVLRQAALFRGADFIVAPHGALMANLVYCKPGTVFVELLPGPYFAICYRSLCHAVGVRYHAVYCTKLAHYRDDAVNDDFTVNPDHLCDVVKSILADAKAA